MRSFIYRRAVQVPLVILVGVVLGVWAKRDRTPGTALWREVRNHEVAGVRLSIGSGFRSCPAETLLAPGSTSGDPCAAEERRASPRALALIRRARLAADASADPAVLHAAALAIMLYPDVRGNLLHQSVSYVESASRLAEHPAPILADLSAAHLMLANHGYGPKHLLEALEAAQHALEIEPGNLPARFNSAEALDRIGLRRRAAEAWSHYLAKDSLSAWGNEARRRRQALGSRGRPPAARDEDGRSQRDGCLRRRRSPGST
jgi:hypothetical protein